MGKPFRAELAQLAVTQQIATGIDVSSLAHTVEASAGFPVYCVGSGGSFTVANIAADLFLDLGAPMSKAVTPLELIALETRLSSCAVWCFSSSGRNSDILAATRFAVQRDSGLTATLCATKMSPLFRLAKEFPQINHWEFQLPSGRDGFLATNSLIAMAMLLMRAFGVSLEMAISRVQKGSGFEATSSPNWIPKSSDFEMKNTIVAIYSPELKAMALDLESKLVEAGLVNCQIADYRSFAHGRHHWLAKHRRDSLVLIFATDRDASMARVISRNIPQDIAQHLVNLPGDKHNAILMGLEFVMNLVGCLGDFRGVDPGRPGVPSFGRRIFNLRSINRIGRWDEDSKSLLSVWADRKAAANEISLGKGRHQKYWVAQCNQFLERLSSAHFRSVVLDYDGTLCDFASRFSGLDVRIKSELSRLLSFGVLLGVATGRGKSVTEALRNSVPREQWDRILVGYYNGAIVQPLDEELRNTAEISESSHLGRVAQLLRDDLCIADGSSIELRAHQLSIVFGQASANLSVWRRVCEIISTSGAMLQGMKVVVSSHSVDVLDTGVSKQNLFQQLRTLGSSQCPPESVLCIGDKGKWPGNDFELLSNPFSLSVDEVSISSHTGWNLSQPGMRGTRSCLLYLSCLSPWTKNSTELRFDVKKLHKEGK